MRSLLYVPTVLILVASGGCSSGTPNGGSSNGLQTAPSITQQPVSAAVTIGETATFTVSATSSSSLTYQWQKNGTTITAATSGSYTTPATAIGDNGAKFDVVVANQYGSTISAMATLTVNPSVALQSIAVTPTSPSTAVGKTQQFTATGTYSDNSTKDLTTSAMWVSSNSGVAAIGANTGLAKGLAAGTALITATLGSVVSPNAALTVTSLPLTLQSITVTPATPSIGVGSTQQFTALGGYSDNSSKNITTSVTWSSSNSGFATIGASSGLATGVAAGTTQIKATLGTVSSSNDPLTVAAVAVTLESIAVTPIAPSISVGSSERFTAAGTYSDNSTKNITTSVTWASSNTGFATIGASTGLATGVAAGTTQIKATLGTVSSPNDPLTVAAVAVTLESIAVTPIAPSISVGSSEQFTAAGTYSDNSTKNITTSVTWASSNTGFATIGASTGLAKGVAAGTAQVTATVGNVVSPNDTLTVTAATSFPTDIVTYHYDNARSGVNAHETILTTASVNSTTFGKLGEFAVDGQIDGQILYLNQVNIPGHGMKNVIYAATERDSVYAFDADSISGNTSAYLWKSSVVPAGESPADAASLPCGNYAFNGVTATPVIDRGRNAIYVVAMTKDSSGNIIDRIHALDLTTGNELFGGPTKITATYPGTGGNSTGGTVTFVPRYHHDRAALLESNGIIYTAWSGLNGDCGNYSAWVIAYSADTLLQSGVIDLVPDNYGAGIWMGGGGPAADGAGNVYVVTGNGFGDTPGINQSYGNSFVKLNGSGKLSVLDYFTPYNTISEDSADLDFGSAGPLLLPDLVDANGVTQHLAIGGGKDCNMYVVSRDNMGQFNAMKNEIHQQIKMCASQNHSSPVFFNGTVYVGPVGTALEAYTMTQTVLPSTPSSQTAQAIGRVVPSVSANGTGNGIVWAVSSKARTLYAYDANNLATKLYDSTQAAGNRDQSAGITGGFITPTITNGKVYFGTGSTVAVYGLLQ